jgi:hypothetical protein
MCGVINPAGGIIEVMNWADLPLLPLGSHLPRGREIHTPQLSLLT